VNVARNLITDSEGLAGSAKCVYLSVPLGKLSSTQLNALAVVTEKYLSQNYIEITPNLNIKFSENKGGSRKKIFDHFVNCGLFVIEADVSLPHYDAGTELKAEDMIIVVDLPNGKLDITQLLGLEKLMRSEDIKDIHLINEREFLFKYDTKGSIDFMSQSMGYLGLKLRTIL